MNFLLNFIVYFLNVFEMERRMNSGGIMSNFGFFIFEFFYNECILIVVGYRKKMIKNF